jgi:O-Antigen ligase
LRRLGAEGTHDQLRSAFERLNASLAERLVDGHPALFWSYAAVIVLILFWNGPALPRDAYCLVVLPIWAMCGAPFLAAALRSPIFWSAAAYCVALAVASLGEPGTSPFLVGTHLGRSLQVLSFVVISAHVARTDLARMVLVLAVAVAASILLNLPLKYGSEPLFFGAGFNRFTAQWGTWGYGNSTNIGGSFAVACAAAVALLVSAPLLRLHRAALVASGAVILVGLMLTLARGALLAFAAGVLVVLLIRPSRAYRIWIGAAAAAIIVGVIAYSTLFPLLEGRGLRLEIWRLFLSHAVERPFGHGLWNDTESIVLPSGLSAPHAHNILLAAQYRGGIPALIALAATWAFALRASFRAAATDRSPVPLCIIVTAFAACMLDYEIIPASPAWPWLMFWLPLGICLGAERTAVRQSSFGARLDRFVATSETVARLSGFRAAVLRKPLVAVLAIGVAAGWLVVASAVRMTKQAHNEYQRLLSVSKGREVHSIGDLQIVAREAGFREGLLYGHRWGVGLAANIATMFRDGAGYINFVGYGFDEDPSGNPVHLYLFMGGRPVATAAARGERDDVTAALGLRGTAVENVGILGRSDQPVACEQTKDLFALIVSRKKEYMILEPTGTHPSHGRIPARVSGCD